MSTLSKKSSVTSTKQQKNHDFFPLQVFLAFLAFCAILIVPTMIMVQHDANERAENYCLSNGGTWGGNDARCAWANEQAE